MFLREVKRENRNGTRVSYLQLVHNDWDPAARTSRTKILYSFGRTDQVDTAAIERLIVSLSRLLDPAAAFRATGGADLSFIGSRPLGGTDVLDGLWHRLGIDTALSRLLAKRRVTSPFERVLFEFARPGTVVLTTPNREFNVTWETLPAGKFRHPDHRFEWTRREFQDWV